MFENHSIICPSSRGKIKALVLKVTHLSEAPQGCCQVRVWLMVCGVWATIAEPAPNHRRAMASPCVSASITKGDAIQTISFTEVKWFVKTTWVLRQLCSINSLTNNISHRFTLLPFHINPELSGIWSERLRDLEAPCKNISHKSTLFSTCGIPFTRWRNTNSQLHG